MNAPVQLPLAERPHRNAGLFSDHYLDNTLPGRPEWERLLDEARASLEQVRPLLAAYAPSQNEAQTERDLVRPVLELLGHTFEVQAPLATPEGTQKPDYIFYRDDAARRANKGKTLDDTLLRPVAYAVGDAKHWDRPLDVALKARRNDPFSNKNPSWQIWWYVQHSGVEWGVLTNGRLWRLYHRDTAHKLDRYYEADLPALVERGDPGRYLYFYAFFRRAAFDPGPLGLSELLGESVRYARGVGESLKAQVYDALRHVAQGFLDYGPNGLDPGALAGIYDASLTLLYRLLFVL
jgi:hypothetical protein